MEEIYINNQKYNLHINCQKDTNLRMKFNEMTQEFWSFDFENFYTSGYWDTNCVLYSLFFEGEIVAHTTVSFFKTTTSTGLLNLAQLGTVMTHVEFQKKGLSRFLMDYITEEIKDKIDGMFLFANETVLDFYPKFGFVPVEEFQAMKTVIPPKEVVNVRKLMLDDKADLELFEHFVMNSLATSNFDTQNAGLSFFYTLAYPDFGFKDSVYYIESLQTIAVVQTEDETMLIVQLFQLKKVAIDLVLDTLYQPEIKNITFGFTPKTSGLTFENYKEEDLTLFVSKELVPYFEKHQLMIPMLSHT